MSLASCESVDGFFDSMNDFSQQVNKTLSDICDSRVIVNFNGGMTLDGEVKISNVHINFFSKNKPKCSAKEAEEAFIMFLKKNNLNLDVKITSTPWKAM